MRRDAQLSLCTDTAFDADAGTTNVIDLGIARNIGDGKPLSMFVHVTVAADHTSGTETFAFRIETDGDVAFGSPTTIVEKSFDYSILTANSLHEVPIQQGAVFEQYLRGFFNGGSTTPTVTASIWIGESGSLPSTKTYPKNYTV